MELKTTTIGSYPKPDYLRIPPFIAKHPDPTERYKAYLASRTDEDNALLIRATEENVRHQIEAGIDIPTDGETPRSHYVHYHLHQLGGIDFDALTEKTKRGGAWTGRFPTVTGKITTGPNFLPDDWRRAQAVTDRPVKITLPGPMTIIDSVADAHYDDETALAADLADALNYEARALTDAGCTQIQIDEPVFARRVEAALEWGIPMLDRAFDGLPDSVTRTVHICCGYPSAVDLDDFPKAPQEAYYDLALSIDALPVQCVSLEDAHRFNDLSLLDLFQDTRVIIGTVQIAMTRVESVEEIQARLREALKHIDSDRLIAGPDCGLAMLDRDTVFAKLQNMCRAAKSV